MNEIDEIMEDEVVDDFDEMMEDEISAGVDEVSVVESKPAVADEVAEMIRKSKERVQEGLIKFFMVDGREMVDARALHKMLGIKTPFNQWIERRIENLHASIDYIIIDVDDGENRGKHNRKDYAITEFLAYKIALTEGNGESDEIIKYLLEGRKICDTPELVVERAEQIYDFDFWKNGKVRSYVDDARELVWKNMPYVYRNEEGKETVRRPNIAFMKGVRDLLEHSGHLLFVNSEIAIHHMIQDRALGMLQDRTGFSSAALLDFVKEERTRIGEKAYDSIHGLNQRKIDGTFDKVLDYREHPKSKIRDKSKKTVDEIMDEEEAIAEQKRLDSAPKYWKDCKTREEQELFLEATRRFVNKQIDDSVGGSPEDFDASIYFDGTKG
jgi:phage anti-repressor protein